MRKGNGYGVHVHGDSLLRKAKRPVKIPSVTPGELRNSRGDWWGGMRVTDRKWYIVNQGIQK